MLHFVYPIARIHFVYYLLRTREAYILLYFEHVLNYIERRYGLKVRIFYRDGETVIRLGNDFTAFIIKKGLYIESSPPYTQAQNSDAERSRGVIIGRGRNIRTSANLPKKL